jgi:hypothetical protein
MCITWFHGMSFIGGVLMVGAAVSSMVHYLRGEDGTLVDAMLASGVFLLLAIAYFHMSMRAGAVERERRAIRKKRKRREAHDRD